MREGICEGNDAANSNGRVDRSSQGGELEMSRSSYPRIHALLAGP